MRDLKIGAIDQGLVGLNGAFILRDRSSLEIDLLFGNESFLQQQLITLLFHLCRLKLRLVASQLSFGLGELNLEWTFVDFGEQIALLNKLTFTKCDMLELAVHAAPDDDGVVGCDRPESTQINGHVHPSSSYGDDCRSPWAHASAASAASASGRRRLRRCSISGCGFYPVTPSVIDEVAETGK